MGIEIERKFLLKNDSWRAAVNRSYQIAQGYFGGDRVSVRVRISETFAWLTIKARVAGSARAEFEYPIPLADAESLLADLSLPGRIEKVRHHVDVASIVWEIDEFSGENAGLVIAEIELPAVDTEFARPDWLGAEVTECGRYYNSALAERPYAQWTASERAPLAE
jgi:adenylate cyclase